MQSTGRVVFQLSPDATELPDIVLEDGDKLVVPPKPTTLGVFGSVFNTGSYLYTEGRTLDDYLHLAGGPTKGADEGSVFVVRANGQVVSSRQQSKGWFSFATETCYYDEKNLGRRYLQHWLTRSCHWTASISI